MCHLTATAASPHAHNKQMGLANIWKFLAAIGNLRDTHGRPWQLCQQTPELSAGRATCGHQQDKTSLVGVTSLLQTTLSAITPHVANRFGVPKQATKDKGQASLSKQCTIYYLTPHSDSSQLD